MLVTFNKVVSKFLSVHAVGKETWAGLVGKFKISSGTKIGSKV